MNLMKKGAMFGLDARIALAIFGALSVISGAALYSAIQDAKITTFYTTLIETEKALEAIVLDLGYMPKSTTGSPDLSLFSQNMANLNNWNGPYMNFDKTFSHSSIFMKKIDAGIYFIYGRMRNGTPTSCSGSTASAGEKRYNYLIINAYNSSAYSLCDMDWNFIKKVHDKYDSDGDYASGKIIIMQDGSDLTKGNLSYRLNIDLGKV